MNERNKNRTFITGHYDMNIAATLKNFRQIKGFSQESLAEASGISIRTIQRLENGASPGNGFTLNALATALGIRPEELRINQQVHEDTIGNNKLKLINLSALCVILIPLSNILLPLIIFQKGDNNAVVNDRGRRILSFQILWTLITMMLMIVIPAVLLLVFQSLRGGGIPLALPVYIGSVLLNVTGTILIAIALNDRPDRIDAIPNIL